MSHQTYTQQRNATIVLDVAGQPIQLENVDLTIKYHVEYNSFDVVCDRMTVHHATFTEIDGSMTIHAKQDVWGVLSNHQGKYLKVNVTLPPESPIHMPLEQIYTNMECYKPREDYLIPPPAPTDLPGNTKYTSNFTLRQLKFTSIPACTETEMTATVQFSANKIISRD